MWRSPWSTFLRSVTCVMSRLRVGTVRTTVATVLTATSASSMPRLILKARFYSSNCPIAPSVKWLRSDAYKHSPDVKEKCTQAVQEIGGRIRNGKDWRGRLVERILIPCVEFFLFLMYIYFEMNSTGIHASRLDNREHITGQMFAATNYYLGAFHIPYIRNKKVLFYITCKMSKKLT